MRKLAISLGFVCLLLINTKGVEDPQVRQEIVPLSSAVKKLNQGKPSLDQLAYVGNRCAALLTSLAIYLENNSNDDRDKELAKRLIAKAACFHTVGRTTGLGLKQSKQFLDDQWNLLVEAYMLSMKQGKMLNNSPYSPLIADDLKAADSVYEMFVELEKSMRARS
ncbi:MAG: hypothetical protein KAX37_01565 [Opitutaceae bacterium]|nr:hypothetical protein [Opitutaceae bacterium]MBP9914519.1 hypothetical protein [Opitutaceae bacterium]